MALECALFYTNANGIQGDNTVAARANSSEVIEVQHETMIGRNASGHTTGRRQHGPLRVLKQLDRATVLLRKALVENQVQPELELRWYRPHPMGTGEIQHFFSIILRNAAVSKTDTLLPNTLNPELARLHPQEWVEFVYETVAWRWIDGGIEHEDTWGQIV
jgi:type VI secretion system secreted protein Hcp